MKDFIETTYYTPIWNPRAKILIQFYGIEEEIQNVFNVAWNYYALNINLIYNNSVYSYFPFENGSCSNSAKVLVLENCNEQENLNGLFLQKVPMKSNRCKMDISAYINPPYFKKQYLKIDDPQIVGLEAVVLNNLLERCNLILNYANTSFPTWGYKYPDGSSTLLYNAIFNKKCHAIVGHININESYYYDFDATLFYIYEYSRWFVPLAKPKIDWENLILVFKKSLWMAVIAALFLNCIVWWITAYGISEKTMFRKITVCFTKTCYVLLQGSITDPESRPLKILYIFWVYVTFLLATAYQSKLISVLTTSRYEHQISNVQDMIKSKLPFGSIPTARNFFKDTDNEEDKLVYDNYITCINSTICMDAIFQGKFGFMMPEMLMAFKLPSYMQRNDTLNSVYAFKKAVKPIMYNMYTLRGYPFLERFNEIILRLQANGLLWKWTDETLKYVVKNEEVVLRPLTLINLYSCFLVLSIGFASALVCIFGELLYFHLKRCIKRRKIN